MQYYSHNFISYTIINFTFMNQNQFNVIKAKALQMKTLAEEVSSLLEEAKFTPTPCAILYAQDGKMYVKDGFDISLSQYVWGIETSPGMFISCVVWTDFPGDFPYFELKKHIEGFKFNDKPVSLASCFRIKIEDPDAFNATVDILKEHGIQCLYEDEETLIIGQDENATPYSNRLRTEPCDEFVGEVARVAIQLPETK